MIKFDKDKQLHALVGAAIGVLAIKFVPALALPILIVVALGKEIYDHCYPDKHTADVTDFLTTVGGGILAMYAASFFL